MIKKSTVNKPMLFWCCACLLAIACKQHVAHGGYETAPVLFDTSFSGARLDSIKRVGCLLYTSDAADE